MRAAVRAGHWRLYAGVYDTLWDTPYTQDLAQEVSRRCRDLGAADIVDVGAGTGLITRQLAAIEGVTCVGCEPLTAMRRRLRRRLPSVPVFPCGLDQLTLDPHPHRVVVAANVLHLMDAPGDALIHLRRLAGPTGAVLVLTPSPETTLTDLVRAQRRARTPIWRILWFLVAHLAMSPLTIISGAARNPAPAVAALRLVAVDREVIGAAELFVIPGLPGLPLGPAPSHT